METPIVGEFRFRIPMQLAVVEHSIEIPSFSRLSSGNRRTYDPTNQ